MLFISSVLIPIEELPLVGQLLAYFSPLTHTLILIRTGLNAEAFSISPIESVIVLIFVGLIFRYVRFWFHEITKRRE